jgi:lipopolysaccharide transport system ATP-binding protein
LALPGFKERDEGLPMSSDPVISLRNVGKSYMIYDQPIDRLKQSIVPKLERLAGRAPTRFFRDFAALNDVSFDIRKGETVGIIGRNGSGKSTLLQIICGTLAPSSGTVTTKGRIAALLELGSGFNPEFTGRENVHMNATILGLTPAEIDTRFADIVAFADIGDFLEQPVKTYSSGMAVRLAFAVIAHVDADILVIDEALAVGDAFFTQKCMRFLRAFMKRGTVLFVTHDTGSVRNLCDRAIWLEKGVVMQEGSAKDVCDLYLQAFYEAQQGASSTTTLRPLKKRDMTVPLKDQRLEFINASNLRNDLEVFEFDPDAASFGSGGAQITDVELLDKDGARLHWVVGGEDVSVRIHVDVNDTLDAPIIGFFIKDRLGQALFGDNTYLSHQGKDRSCAAGATLQAVFAFQMPILPVGDYSVTVAIANGTQDLHVQHHWIHDAVLFKAQSSSVATGLIGIPMSSIEFKAR